MSLSERFVRFGRDAHRALRLARVGLWRFKRSPEQRDRASMYATFAVIGLLAFGSIDAIVTGNADFGPSPAYADEYRAPRVAPAQAVVATAAPVEVEDVVVVKTIARVEMDYSFTTEVLLGGPDAAGETLSDIAAAGAELSPL